MTFLQNTLNKLSKSEKRLLVGGLILIVLALFWVWIYKPLTQSIENKSQQLANLNIQLEDMQSRQKELQVQPKTQQRNQNLPFISWIDQQLGEKALADSLTRSEPNSDGSLTLTFENVAFDNLIDWLQPLLGTSVQLQEADFSLLDKENGLVNARLTLME